MAHCGFFKGRGNMRGQDDKGGKRAEMGTSEKKNNKKKKAQPHDNRFLLMR